MKGLATDLFVAHFYLCPVTEVVWAQSETAPTRSQKAQPPHTHGDLTAAL